jgi:predicted RNase H-like HicB family nuclease
VKVREAIRLIEGDGWQQVRQRGSHRGFTHPTKPGAGDDRRQAVCGLAPQDGGEHHATSWTEIDPDPDPDPDPDLILIVGGPPSNYSAWSPDLPGCVASGDTFDECLGEMRSAIAFHLEILAENGDPIPEPTGPGVYVEQHAAAA